MNNSGNPGTVISLHPNNSAEHWTRRAEMRAFARLAKDLQQFFAENRVVEPS